MSPSPAPSHRSRSSLSSVSIIPESVTHAASTLFRRITEPLSPTFFDGSSSSAGPSLDDMPSVQAPGGVFPAPKRTESPFNPPPLTGLILHSRRVPTTPVSPASPISPGGPPILTRALAEEIRLLLPPRLQLATDWRLIFSVDTDGVSLTTLYNRCEPYRKISGSSSTGHGAFVLVVKDAGGGVFGAFLTDAPHPQPHYYGTGECFLWRATILPATAALASLLPPPPSADTTNMQRSTTVSGAGRPPKSPRPANGGGSHGLAGGEASGTSTPDRIRFKAFPYSGVNDYMIFCRPDYLSVGGGDGHYGLWLDSSLERGISSRCLTFGNEALSEEGEKFEVIGVEIWCVGT